MENDEKKVGHGFFLSLMRFWKPPGCSFAEKKPGGRVSWRSALRVSRKAFVHLGGEDSCRMRGAVEPTALGLSKHRAMT